ncbi:Peptidase family M23 [Flavobacteriaceae bacterium MAR_2010_188]|nr:Peptidase family M23 [Flavobacteriaceae bacterium MAR_2010_188]
MRFLPLFLLSFYFSFSQIDYPKDYFRSPLDIPIVLAGTFAELRSNHFHSGIDIKTQGREGLNVYAAADGYVSRIKIEHFGYGKAIYITHPNGYTTVYAHLNQLSPRLEKYIKQCQYEKESYAVEMFPAPSEYPISKGELIALSGNTGSSGGPHVHYEIRDNNERPINPMLFGVEVADTKVPKILSVYAYTADENASVNNEQGRIKLRLTPAKGGDFNSEKITASGEIGFGVVSYDQQDMANNKNGLYNIQTFTNGNKSLEIDFHRFSFGETKNINRLIDYEYYKVDDNRIQKLFVEPNNPLSIYKDAYENGYLKIEDNASYIYKIRIRDFAGNESWVSIPIEGVANQSLISESTTGNLEILENQSTTFEEGNYKVTIPANTVYDNQMINAKVSNDTLYLHEDILPLRKNFSIEYDISAYKDSDKDKLYIASLYGYYKKPSYLRTQRKDDKLVAWTDDFGMFTLGKDLDKPKIQPINFQDQKWISNQNTLVIKIEDELSGISDFRATINGKWILMEYEYKKKTLTYNFDDSVISEAENNLKLIVTDNVGNSSTFEATFFRK